MQESNKQLRSIKHYIILWNFTLFVLLGIFVFAIIKHFPILLIIITGVVCFINFEMLASVNIQRLKLEGKYDTTK